MMFLTVMSKVSDFVSLFCRTQDDLAVKWEIPVESPSRLLEFKNSFKKLILCWVSSNTFKGFLVLT
jgi:hypothetical protein